MTRLGTTDTSPHRVSSFSAALVYSATDIAGRPRRRQVCRWPPATRRRLPPVEMPTYHCDGRSIMGHARWPPGPPEFPEI